jgi:hypothetical protein
VSRGTRITSLPAFVLWATVLAAACRTNSQHTDVGATPSVVPGARTLEVARPGSLDQGWDDTTRESFWFTPQGSKVMPYAWFLAVEQADSQELLRSAANMERFRYIPMPQSRLNPDGLPLGFVRDADPDGSAFLGLTCAACHTSKLVLGGHEVIIDGGPTLADFKTFLHELNRALTDTQADDAKFARFAKGVLGDAANDAAKAALRSAVTSVTGDLVKREAQDHTDVQYGYARLDAFGAILNNVAATDLGMPQNAATPDAPVSYPFIWDAPQADRVQWNGSALNAPKVGGLIRNIGEVLGVFGRLAIKPARGLTLDRGYENSVNLENLGKLENWLRELWSPKWPSQYLPAVNDALVQKGEGIYAQNCGSCHKVLDSRNPGRRFEATMVPVATVGTDPTMASNYLERTAKTGILQGQRSMILAGDRLGPEARTFQIVVNGVVGVLLQRPLQAALVGEADAKRARELARLTPEVAPAMTSAAEALTQLKDHLEKYAGQFKLFDATTNAYKARPLNGIWATAPYLHNGSVPSLWTLLQRVDQRPKTFAVGSREFDAKNVGLRGEGGPGTATLDTSLHGNSNGGHEYGAGLSDDDKWALIEYVKTL